MIIFIHMHNKEKFNTYSYSKAPSLLADLWIPRNNTSRLVKFHNIHHSLALLHYIFQHAAKFLLDAIYRNSGEGGIGI